MNARRWIGLVLLGGLAASGAVAVEDPPGWVKLFADGFTENPIPRYKMLPVPEEGKTSAEGTSSYDAERHAFVVGGRLAIVQPVRAGAFVEWKLGLRFEPKAEGEKEGRETDLTLVLADGSTAGVHVVRPKEDAAEPTTLLRFAQESGEQARPVFLREYRVPGRARDGEWKLRYRHGMLTLLQGNEVLGYADTGALGVEVVGVSWTQKGGEVACDHMEVWGEPPRGLPAEALDTLKSARELNERAKRLLGEQKAEEASRVMEEASALYVQVNGEDHHDSANSFTNLATIQEAMEKMPAARALWEKALGIHEATLGPGHPHTTLTRFNLGKNLLQQGDRASAKELWTRCRDDWREVPGPERDVVKSLDTLLPRL